MRQSRLYGSAELYKPLVQSNAGTQILTPHISATTEPILIKLEIKKLSPEEHQPYKTISRSDFVRGLSK